MWTPALRRCTVSRKKGVGVGGGQISRKKHCMKHSTCKIFHILNGIEMPIPELILARRASVVIRTPVQCAIPARTRRVIFGVKTWHST